MVPPMRRGTVAAFLLVLVPAAVAWAHPDISVLEDAAAEEAARHPDDPAILMQQALAQQVAGQWDAALASLAHAAEHGADADEVGAARGRVYLAAGWPRMAKLELDRVLARHPDRLPLVYDRGQAWLQLGNAEEAARDFGRAVAGLPEPRPEQVFAHRDALLWLGRRADAVAALDAGIARLGPVASLELAAVDLEEELGRHADALRRLDLLLGQNPQNEAWVARRGDILARAGRSGEAHAAFAHALALIESRPGDRRGERVEALERRLRAALALADTRGKP